MRRYIDRDALLKSLPEDLPYKASVKRVLIQAPTADVVEVRHGEWEWFEDWLPSTTEHPRELNECGWRCGKCKSALADLVGGYWDDSEEKPKLNFCPECGAKMDGERSENGKS